MIQSMRKLLLSLSLVLSLYPFDCIFAIREHFNIEDFEIGTEQIQYNFRDIPLENLVSGPGIVAQYDEQRSSPTPLSGGDIFHCALASRDKKPELFTTRELLCHDIIFSGINALATKLIPHLYRCPRYHITIIAFGGAVCGAGNFYLTQLEAKLNKMLNFRKKVSIFASPLGDERPLIGAAVIALKRSPQVERPYILSIDMGGTHVRMGLVDVKTLKMIPQAKIVAMNTFASAKEFSTMRQLRATLQENAKPFQDFSEIPDYVKIKDFLPAKRARISHGRLRESLLDRLCEHINQFDLNQVECISIASPGLNQDDGYVKLAYNVPLTGVHLVKEVQKRLTIDVPVVVTGDVASAGVGELLAGAGKELQHFFILGIGTGINLCYVERKRAEAYP